jgi:DNA-binding CsgD family transcriptional regulator
LPVLYGRDAERREIGALLDSARASRSGALVLRGEAGVGKTALLLDAREQAGDMEVLSARGVESESELPFAALSAVLRPALGYLRQLPEPQRVALSGALGLEAGAAEQHFLVFAACLSLLAEVAERRPVLCLVDDAHWLDAASADALRFVARRLDAEGIAMLFAARQGEVRDFEATDVPSLQLERLDDEAANALLTQVRADVAAPVRNHLVRQSRGNALALTELPSALNEAQLAGDEPIPEALPLTDQVESIFLGRVRRLPEDTQRLLLLTAIDDTEDAALIARAAKQLDLNPEALDAAERAGLVSVRGTRIDFRHPLVRSAISGAATSSDRRAAHRALANALEHEADHADRHAWHLASSVLEHDEDAVQALEQAAERAQNRAGHVAAARALERAAELSSDDAARGRLLVRATRAARIAGADELSVALAEQARPLVDDPLLRSEIAYAVGLYQFRRARPVESAQTLLEAAREVATLDHRLALEQLIWATGAASIGGDAQALMEVAALIATIVPPGVDEDATMVVHALTAFAEGTFTGGIAQKHEDEELDKAMVWATSSRNAQYVFAVGVAALYAGDDQRFGTLMNRAISLARERGEFGLLAEALALRAAELMVAQRYDEAELAANEAVQFTRELGAGNVAARSMAVLAFIAAVHGDEGETRERARDLLDLATARGLAPSATQGSYALALLDLGHGRWAEAFERFEAVRASSENVGSSIMVSFAMPDIIEAAVRADHLDTAREALSAFEQWVDLSAARWARPALAGLRAILADGDEATGHFEEALRMRADARPFDFARIQLHFGQHLRRERRRSDSRVQLRAAIEAFERLRAEPWLKRARVELRASGETARKRDPSTMDQLTPQELQIARFVAQGMANKEVAAHLFLSPRTIDYHLRNVFAKLGIKSRTQLARMPLGEEEESASAVTVA